MSISTILFEFVDFLLEDEMDKILTPSDKRQKEFKKAFTSSKNTKLNLKDKKLKEADATAPSLPTDPNNPSVPGNNLPSNAPIDPNADPTLNDPQANPVDPTMGLNSPGMGLGGGLGGSSAPMGGPSPESDPSAANEPEESESDNSDVESEKGDPIESMVSDAKTLLDKTQDPSLIAKDLKQKIQSEFEDPSHALGLIKALYDTNNTILQSSALQLYLFLKAKPPIQ